MIADRNSWKNSPAPAEREDFKVTWPLSPVVVNRMIEGHVPESMDDRWFIIMEDGWLLFHRSWTGNCLFGLKVDNLPEGSSITKGWVSRKTEEYSSTDVDQDIELVYNLIREYFLMPPRTPVSPFGMTE